MSAHPHDSSDASSAPDRWSRVKALVATVLDRSPADRAAFLDQACDPALRAEIDLLLAAADRAGGFLEVPAIRCVTSLPPVLERAGPYRLVREIGSGGMGSVYLAIRADDEYRKEVALKIVGPGLRTPDVLRRFRQERQTLANLVHPNIARLLDGGSTDQGLPYFVMDYVDGLPIDEYCDRGQLGIDERVQLCRSVCAAVQYAHQNLVVHRDLKPDNILVTSDGVPKLVDFGIAKVLDSEARLFESTIESVRPMTLRYASPEQVAGMPVTTAADQYSLAVVMYELLTGHSPYRLQEYRKDELERAIREQEPDRPSTAVTRTQTGRNSDGSPLRITPEVVSAARAESPARLRRRLTGDLDTILLTALRKEPSRRYPSVEQFAEDLRRYQDGRPVVARTDTLPYRAGKFIRRNRLGVAAAAALLIALLGGIGATTWQAQVAARERDRARAEAAKSNQISQFLQEMIGTANAYESPRPVSPNKLTVAQMFDRATERLERGPKLDPAIEAALRRTIAGALVSLGRYDAAESQIRKALLLHEGVSEPDGRELARSRLVLATALSMNGTYAEAEREIRAALAARRAISAERDELLGQILVTMGWILWQGGRADEAQATAQEALTVNRGLLGDAHRETAVSWNLVGVLSQTRGDLDTADHAFREAIATLDRSTSPDHAVRSTILVNLATLARAQRRYADAERLYEQALAHRRSLVGDDHPDVAVMRSLLAGLHLRQGRLDTAEQYILDALAVQQRVLPPGQFDRTKSLLTHGHILTITGRAAEAEAQLREALAVRRGGFKEHDWQVAEAAGLLGACLSALGRHGEAEPLLRQAHEDLRRLSGDQDYNVQVFAEALARLYDASGQPARAAAIRAPASRP